MIFTMVVMATLDASSHREAPLISNDPLADNVDVYAFRSPDNPNTVTLIATFVPFQLPHGGPNYYTFGENIRYEIHVDNDANVPGDEVTYRFTFNLVNEDPTTFFNIRLGAQNQKATYTLERSLDGGNTFETIVTDGIVPPNNIGERSITGPAGLGASSYDEVWANAITTASSGETVFAGPSDDPFFVDLGGIFDLGDAPRQNGTPTDGVACYNVSTLAIQVPISTLLKDGAAATPSDILDPDYVIGVWASASRPALTTLSASGEPTYSGDFVQVSRLGMPLTNEAVIPVGQKDFWNSLSPYDEISETTLDEYFYNPELALYMDDDQFGGAVPAFSPLRIQTASLGAFDFTNGADGVSALAGTDLTGTAFEMYGDLLLIPGKPRSVDLWPIFHTGVPNAIPYQLATGKEEGNPLTAGKPFINNFLPNGGDMLRLNMAVPPTPRDDANFSSLGLVQAAAIGLTVAPFNTTADLEFLPNMDGFPNGRRLEDDVTRIELQAVGGVVLAAVGLFYDDYAPGMGQSPVTDDLVGVLSYTTGIEANDKDFRNSFPYVALPFSGKGGCSGVIYDATPIDEGDDVLNIFVSSNTTPRVGVIGVDATDDLSFTSIDVVAEDADGIHYSSDDDVLYQLNRTDNVINAYSDVKASIANGSMPTLTATSTSDFVNGREITVLGNKLIVAQDASDGNGMVNKFVVYNISPDAIQYDGEYTTTINLWGIQLVGKDLYAIEDNSSNLAVFTNFLENQEGEVSPSRSIAVEGIVRTHGLAVDEDNNVMILTDVADGGNPDDGAIVIVRDYVSAIENNMIEAEEQVRIEGSSTTLGNPVDVSYDYQNDRIYVAERANGGGRILAFEGDTAGGNVAPSYSRDFSGASAIYYSDLLDPVVVNETIAQFFTSSNTEATVTAYDIKENGTIDVRSFQSSTTDADGIYYDEESDVLYELDRDNNVINAYSDVNASLDNNTTPPKTATSTSDFSNGREIAVSGNKLVVAQDASAANGMVNKLVIYDITPTSITLDNEFVTDFNLWGITFDEDGNLLAVMDNTNMVAIINDFLNTPIGGALDFAAVAVDGIVRTHGLTYDDKTDLLILTDVADGGNPDDGALIFVPNAMDAVDDLLISASEQTRIEGPNSNLGNPVDVAYDRINNVAYVAERAHDGGRVLGFTVNSDAGDIAPVYDVLQPGVSAIFLGNKDEDVDVVVPEINIFNPNFSDDILIAARMTGGNEVPAVTTDAVGVATVTFNDDYTMATINATVSGLSSAFTGAHIHLGDPGTNGDVVFNFTDEYNQGRLQSTFAVTNNDVATFIDGGYYLNIHTESNPGGELRGNLALEAAETFIAFATGDEEVPSVDTEGVAIASLFYTSNTNVLEVRVQASKLSGPITGIHLHAGNPGENGDVVENLTPFLVGNTVNVKLQAGDYIDALRNGGIYLNVHTEANPSGEVRSNFFIPEGIYFDAFLGGSQEVPAVDSESFGYAVGLASSDLSVLEIAVITDNLSGPITGAHFHNGALGENGDVVVNLTDLVSDNLIVTNEDIALTPELLSSYLSGNLYLNIHTDTYPSGEIRGQAYRTARDGYAYDICQDQEVGDVVNAGNASGSGMLAFNRDYDEMHLMVVANELSSEFQGAHIHNAPVGEDGDVVFNFSDSWANGGAFLYITDEFTSELAGQIQSENAYVNVHTTNNPAGELRGQIVKELTCPLDVGTIEVNGEILEALVYPNPTATDITLQLAGDERLYDGATLIVSDINGRQLRQQTVSQEYTTIATNDFDSGVYFITIRGAAYTHTMKFTKVK